MPEDERPLPAHVTMPLLELVRASALDEDYATAAKSRPVGEDTPRSGRPTWLTTAIAVTVFGLLVCTAFVQTRSQQADRLATRTSLIQQITERKESASVVQDRLGRLQATVLRMEQRRDALDAESRALDERVRRLETRTGYGPVMGEGVRIVVDSAPGAAPRDGVRDSDLALLVDGLWNAGAEAIAINDHRLTNLTSIRNSGYAILVGGKPLSPPYRVEAIGDTRTMQARLVASSRGARFFTLADNLGFRVTQENVARLHLPAATPRTLRFAQPLNAQTSEEEDQ